MKLIHYVIRNCIGKAFAGIGLVVLLLSWWQRVPFWRVRMTMATSFCAYFDASWWRLLTVTYANCWPRYPHRICWRLPTMSKLVVWLFFYVQFIDFLTSRQRVIWLEVSTFKHLLQVRTLKLMKVYFKVRIFKTGLLCQRRLTLRFLKLLKKFMMNAIGSSQINVKDWGLTLQLLTGFLQKYSTNK